VTPTHVVPNITSALRRQERLWCQETPVATDSAAGGR
jgi:hypothetical protein